MSLPTYGGAPTNQHKTGSRYQKYEKQAHFKTSTDRNICFWFTQQKTNSAFCIFHPTLTEAGDIGKKRWRILHPVIHTELMDLSSSLFFFIALYSVHEVQCSKNPKFPLIESGEHPSSLCRALCAGFRPGRVGNRKVSQPVKTASVKHTPSTDTAAKRIAYARPPSSRVNSARPPSV